MHSSIARRDELAAGTPIDKTTRLLTAGHHSLRMMAQRSVMSARCTSHKSHLNSLRNENFDARKRWDCQAVTARAWVSSSQSRTSWDRTRKCRMNSAPSRKMDGSPKA
eukprot:scaffold253118_cov28-Tisochrysis_lutea.AAC.1